MKLVTQATALILATLMPLLLAACSSSASKSPGDTPSKSSLAQRFQGGYTVGTDAQGNPKMQSERRSSFEGGRYGGATGSIEGKTYRKKSFNRQRWSGARDYNTQSYAGARAAQGYDKSPHYLKQNAHLASTSRHSRQGYQSSQYQTGQALEHSRQVRTGANAYTENRRDKRPKAPITSYREEQELSVQDTRRLLGR